MSLLRRYLPTSLMWRTILIVATPMIGLQLVIVWVIIDRHFEGVTRQLTRNVAVELSYTVSQINKAESLSAARSEVLRAAEAMSFEGELTPDATIPKEVNILFFEVLSQTVEDTLEDVFDKPVFVAYERSKKIVDVRLRTKWGVFRARIPHRRMVVANPYLVLTWTGAAAVLLITVAILYLRNQIRPIQKLAHAARAFGRGQSVPLRIAGAREVRQAASAFLDSRARIERHIEQRTRMLSGVSHDLRTPLTRMRLELDLMDESEAVRALRGDVSEMSNILDEFLSYARGDHGEKFVVVDVAELTRDVAEEARRGGRILTIGQHVETPGETRVAIRPRAIKRCLHNLLENAFAHAKRVAITIIVNRAFVEFVVEDDGPGIDEQDREAALRPFHRLDQSRNRNNKGETGGVGLGLALAMDTARGHGGDIVLGVSQTLGGLRAAMRLPR